MKALEVGELIVGSYLKIIKECDIIDYNVREPSGGLLGLEELDIVGIKFDTKEAYICEATTHLDGLNIGNNSKTIQKIATKHKRQIQYSNEHLKDFPNRHYMFWSPCVPIGVITKGLSEIKTLELVINKEYTAKIDELRKEARITTKNTGNEFFRILQILEHLKK